MNVIYMNKLLHENMANMPSKADASLSGEDRENLEQLRRFRDLHNQIPKKDLIPISHPDKYLSED